MQQTRKPTDDAALLAVIDPDAYTAATYTSGYVSVALFASLMAVVYAGDLGASATLDFKVQSASDGSGTGVADITGAAITQLTQAGTDSNKQAIININVDNLPEGHDFVRLSMTVGTATSDCGAALYGFGPRYAPASANDNATVDEIVTV